MTMSVEQSPYTIHWLDHIKNVPQKEWDRLAIRLSTPFLEWEWLKTLEDSESASPKTGWIPKHLTLWRKNKLMAAAPLYVKLHSSGEFIFDQIWLEVSHKLGLMYYPKLLGMSPFTPMPGYRFLIDPEEDELKWTTLLLEAIDYFCQTNRITSCNFLFIDPDWRKLIEKFGYQSWIHKGFTWINPGYSDFDHFLQSLKSNKRKNIKKERQVLKDLGIFLKSFYAQEIPESFIPIIYQYYAKTNEHYAPWNCKYLNQEFFQEIYEKYKNRLLMIAAFQKNDPDHPLGMSMLVRKGEFLYGRYWGCRENINYLHFNTCYYAPIQWAIENNITQFDPGIGGEHKLYRGFQVIASHSLHKFYHPYLQSILNSHIKKVNQLELKDIKELNRILPYKNLISAK